MSNQKLSLEHLRETPEFLKLTKKQRLWIGEYILDYDQTRATKVAYQCKSDEVARIMSYSIVSSTKIIAVLNLHFNREPIEEFLDILDRAIYNRKLTPSQVEVLKLKADILGLGSKIRSKHPIRDIVLPKCPKKEPKPKQKKVEPPAEPPKPHHRHEVTF